MVESWCYGDGDDDEVEDGMHSIGVLATDSIRIYNQ